MVIVLAAVDINLLQSAQVEFEPIFKFAKTGAVFLTFFSDKKRDVVFTTKENLKSIQQH